jgi:GT2 family glycosyltransferase
MGGHWRVHHAISTPPPLVTLVIPTRNRRELLIKCVESILEKTTYENFEILIADNESDDPKLKKYYKKAVKRGRFSVISCPGPFNYSAINNRAVEHAHGEIIGLLNNDLEAINADWLDEMVGHALRAEIGVVGAKLYYPDMTVQHAGVITGIGGVAGHAFKHTAQRDPGTPQNRAYVTHNVSALTAACVVLRKSVFLEAGGFEENNLKIAFNDVDFCLRVQDLGYLNVFTPFAELIHHESASRGLEDSPEKVARFQTEVAFMKQRWGDRLVKDPAYNPNLTLETEDFGFACPPRTPSLG